MPERFTVIGGYGFIGGAVSARLEAEGHEVCRVHRRNWPAPGSDLGNVIFAAGMTADFRQRLAETVEVQLVRLHEALCRYSYDSFLYLSSARVYAGSASTREESPLLVRPADPDHVYNLSKLAAESLCLASPHSAVRVVRLSNVFGAGDVSSLFLTAVLREAVATGRVTIGQAPHSSKDYVPVEVVVRCLVQVARRGRHRLYNVASGRNLTHGEIAGLLQSAGYQVRFAPDGPAAIFPTIDVSRLTQEAGPMPEDVAGAIGAVLAQLQQSTRKRTAG